MTCVNVWQTLEIIWDLKSNQLQCYWWKSTNLNDSFHFCYRSWSLDTRYATKKQSYKGSPAATWTNQKPGWVKIQWKMKLIKVTSITVVPPGGEHQLTGGAEQLLVPEERNTANATFPLFWKELFVAEKTIFEVRLWTHKSQWQNVNDIV